MFFYLLFNNRIYLVNMYLPTDSILLMSLLDSKNIILIKFNNNKITKVGITVQALKDPIMTMLATIS